MWRSENILQIYRAATHIKHITTKSQLNIVDTDGDNIKFIKSILNITPQRRTLSYTVNETIIFSNGVDVELVNEKERKFRVISFTDEGIGKPRTFKAKNVADMERIKDFVAYPPMLWITDTDNDSIVLIANHKNSITYVVRDTMRFQEILDMRIDQQTSTVKVEGYIVLPDHILGKTSRFSVSKYNMKKIIAFMKKYAPDLVKN